MNKEKIKVLIADDEPLARALIAELLKDHRRFEVVGECADGFQAVEKIQKLRPDLLFLDVQMPGLDGLTVLEKLENNLPPAVIFVTAYDQYAIQAFDFHAIDYLLKPYSRARFEEALIYAEQRITGNSQTEMNTQISAPLAAHKNKSAPLKRIFVKEKEKIVLLEPEKIDFLEADDKYVRINVAARSYLVRQTLNSFELELDPQLFVRIHRSSIVNLTRVVELHPMFNGEYLLSLQTGKKLTLSRNYKNRFFEKFGKVE